MRWQCLEMPALGLAGIDGKPDGLAEGVRKAGHRVEETFTFGPRGDPLRTPRSYSRWSPIGVCGLTGPASGYIST